MTKTLSWIVCAFALFLGGCGGGPPPVVHYSRSEPERLCLVWRPGGEVRLRQGEGVDALRTEQIGETTFVYWGADRDRGFLRFELSEGVLLGRCGQVPTSRHTIPPPALDWPCSPLPAVWPGKEVVELQEDGSVVVSSEPE